MGNKSFTAGMEAGAKPFEEKFKKQADAFDTTADRLDSKLDDIKGVTDTLVDDGLARERKEVFGLNTLFDINGMEDTEKILVVSLLYTLAQRFEANDYQKNYIRSVQKYLGLKNVQPADTLAGVENVKDTDSQKAILQVVMEYLFLDGFSFDFLDEEDYEELFDSFNVNRKGFREVENAIENIYQAVGAEGLAEKYGSSDAESEESNGEDTGVELPESLDIYVIERDLTINEGETVKITNKELVFEKSIICSGTLIFDNCCVRYNEEGKAGRIILENNGQLELLNCDVYCNEYRNNAFIIAKDDSSINITKTLFYQCVAFSSGENMKAFSMSDCSFMECWTDFVTVSVNPMAVFVLENSEFFFNTFPKMLLDIDNNGTTIWDYKSIFKFDGKADISNITVTAAYRDLDRKPIKVDTYPTLFNSTKSGVVVLRNSRFNGAKRITNGVNTEIRNCRFDECEQLYGKTIDSCVFVGCQNLATAVIYDVGEVVNCVFSSCKAPLFAYLHATIRKCTFYNVKINDWHFIEFSAIENGGSPGEVVDCIFDGIRIHKESRKALIACGTLYNKNISPAFVKNCKFYNAISDYGPKELIKKTTMVEYGLFGNKQKPVELVSVSGIAGDTTAVPGTYVGSNPSIPTTDNLNRPIGGGAKLNTEVVGVQLANQAE